MAVYKIMISVYWPNAGLSVMNISKAHCCLFSMIFRLITTFHITSPGSEN